MTPEGTIPNTTGRHANVQCWALQNSVEAKVLLLCKVTGKVGGTTCQYASKASKWIQMCAIAYMEWREVAAANNKSEDS